MSGKMRLEIASLDYVLRLFMFKSAATQTRNLCYNDCEVIEFCNGFLLRRDDDSVVDVNGEVRYTLTELREGVNNGYS